MKKTKTQQPRRFFAFGLVLLLLFALAFLVACGNSSSSNHPIVGRWESSGAIIEFSSDGSGSLPNAPNSFQLSPFSWEASDTSIVIRWINSGIVMGTEFEVEMVETGSFEVIGSTLVISGFRRGTTAISSAWFNGTWTKQ